jgi:hypothetical protein
MKPAFTFALLGLSLGLFAQNPDQQRILDTFPQQEKSIFSLGLSYGSQVMSAGRDFGVEQFGVYPSFSYRHFWGFYTQISGSIFGERNAMNYQSTYLGLGFSRNLGQRWRYDLSLSRTLFHPIDEGLLANALGLCLDYSAGIFNFGLSTTGMAGEETALRMNAFGSAWLGLGKGSFALSPSFSALFGTENIILYSLPLQQFRRGTGINWADRPPRDHRPGHNNPEPANPFGLMNLNLSLPLYFSSGNWSLNVSPNLTLPILIQGELFNSQAATIYVSMGLNRTF